MGTVEQARRHTRVAVDIPVTITTILSADPAQICDLSEGGALVNGLTGPSGTRIQIDYQGQTVFGVITWSEFDRCGVRFAYLLTSGPLHEELMRTRAALELPPKAAPSSAFRSSRVVAAQFGRRGLS